MFVEIKTKIEALDTSKTTTLTYKSNEQLSLPAPTPATTQKQHQPQIQSVQTHSTRKAHSLSHYQQTHNKHQRGDNIEPLNNHHGNGLTQSTYIR